MQKDRSVLITGSSRGLGEGLALVFASQGYNVILHGRDEEALVRVKEGVVKKGVICRISSGDLKCPEVIEELAKIATAENISVLINNAAVECPHLPLDKVSNGQIDDLIAINLTAPIMLTQKIYSLFLMRGDGSIININSLSGLENQHLRSVYCAGKWGLRGFTDTLRLEAKEHNIRIVGVYPGRIRTKPEFTYGMSADEAAEKIFDAYEYTDTDEVILDKRPEKLKECKK